jgi:uncharacterized membrane protein YuzA (DUF378 family)
LTAVHEKCETARICTIRKSIFSIIKAAPSPVQSEKCDGGKMKTLDVVSVVLLVVGGLNWGLVAVAHFDLVAAIFGMHFGETSALSSVVYALVGLAAVYQGVSFKAMQNRWRYAAASAH